MRTGYQHVEAATPKRAYWIGKQQPECWESCDWHDSNAYRVSNEVQDLETEEFMRVDSAKHCRTCGSGIVETINDSNFRDGECGPCEYERYKSQAGTPTSLMAPRKKRLRNRHARRRRRVHETHSMEVRMSAIKLTIHSTGLGTCALTGKETDGMTVSFEDGMTRETFLSWKGFRQLLSMKTGQAARPEPRPQAANGLTAK